MWNMFKTNNKVIDVSLEVFIVNFKHIPRFFLVLLLFKLNR